MNLLKKLIIIAVAIALISSLWQCSAPEAQTSMEEINIPNLIDRSEKIQQGSEWESIQNSFAKQRKVLSSDPENAEALLTLSQIYVNEARVTGEHGHYYPAALEVLDRLLESNTIDKDQKFIALTNKAGVQLSLHEFSKAKETATAAYELNPSNAQVHGALVDAYVELGQYKNAIFAADKMNAIKPDIRSYSRISYLREIHGDVEGAIEAMRLAVTAGFPGTEPSAWAMLTLGELYQRYDQPDKAKAVFEAILAERPDYPFAVGALASLAFEEKKYDKTEALLNEAMNIIPEVGFYVQMAELYKEQGRTAEMKKLLKEIFLMLEDDVQHGHNMNLEYASIYLDILEDTQKAKEFAQNEFNKRPENIDVNLMMAQIYFAENDTENMKICLEKAGKTSSKNPALTKLKTKALASL